MRARFTWGLAAFACVGIIVAIAPVAFGAGSHSATKKGAAAKSSLPGNVAIGKKVFIEFCGKCHTLAAAGSRGTLGPNLDQDKVGFNRVVTSIEEGVGGIQAEYVLRQVTFNEVYDVAKFVALERQAGGTAGEGND